MSTPKPEHSPLPWHVELADHAQIIRAPTGAPDDNGDILATCYSKHDAALIVHRVNTYDALVAALKEIVYMNTAPGAPEIDRQAAMVRIARAALSSARGEV